MIFCNTKFTSNSSLGVARQFDTCENMLSALWTNFVGCLDDTPPVKYMIMYMGLYLIIYVYIDMFYTSRRFRTKGR